MSERSAEGEGIAVEPPTRRGRPHRRRPHTGTDLSLDGLVDPNLTLESTDSPRLRIRFEGDGEALTVVMEADASVGGIERRSQPRSDPGIEETPQ